MTMVGHNTSTKLTVSHSDSIDSNLEIPHILSIFVFAVKFALALQYCLFDTQSTILVFNLIVQTSKSDLKVKKKLIFFLFKFCEKSTSKA